MDATANELDDVKIVNFPTLTLYKKETNQVQISHLNDFYFMLCFATYQNMLISIICSVGCRVQWRKNARGSFQIH